MTSRNGDTGRPTGAGAANARELIRDAAPASLRHLTRVASDALADDTTRDALAQACAVALALGNMFREAMNAGGRHVVELIFSLHHSLQHNQSMNQAEIERLAERPQIILSCRQWWDHHAQPGSPWRPVLIRWIDGFSERLTMPAYADPHRRTRHAAAFIADPLRLIAGQPIPPAAPGLGARDALDRTAEQWLGFWDILHAAENATRGLNRLNPPTANHMGGFYALDESVRPPEAAEIRRAAEVLCGQMRAEPPAAFSPALDPALGTVHAAMIEALDSYARQQAWPGWVRAAEPENLLSQGVRWVRSWFS